MGASSSRAVVYSQTLPLPASSITMSTIQRWPSTKRKAPA
jgi:hypothetical protein